MMMTILKSKGTQKAKPRNHSKSTLYLKTLRGICGA